MTDLPFLGEGDRNYELWLEMQKRIGIQKIGDFKSIGVGRLQFKEIPQTFSHLKIVARMQSQNAASTNAFLQYNAISSATYYWTYTGVSSVAQGNGPGTAPNQTYAYIGPMGGTNRPNDNYFTCYDINIPFYSRNDCAKSIDSHAYGVGGGSEVWNVTAHSLCNASANAMTSIDIGEIIGAGLGPRSQATLYGII